MGDKRKKPMSRHRNLGQLGVKKGKREKNNENKENTEITAAGPDDDWLTRANLTQTFWVSRSTVGETLVSEDEDSDLASSIPDRDNEYTTPGQFDWGSDLESSDSEDEVELEGTVARSMCTYTRRFCIRRHQAHLASATPNRQGLQGPTTRPSHTHPPRADEDVATYSGGWRLFMLLVVQRRDPGQLGSCESGHAPSSQIAGHYQSVSTADLQTVGEYVCAKDICDYLDQDEVKTRRWTLRPSGQFVDGHERVDVVHYRQNIFLPAWNNIQSRTRQWKEENMMEEEVLLSAHPPVYGPRERQIVVWFHDESTFYANDRRRRRWVHKSETAMPRPKGEGASLMVADFVSADYSFLRSPDGTESSRVLFKAGKNREGYFTNEDILAHAKKAMDI